MTAGPEHRPVLLEEAIAALNLRADGIYIDGTFGRGGHAAAILARLGAAGRLLAFDKDPEAVRAAREQFGADARFAIAPGSFARLADEVAARGWLGGVDGVLLDLGVSSPQLDDARRGFSFRQDGPLDMRMDNVDSLSAAAWLAQVSEEELARVLHEYGEERFARRIARAIVEARRQAPIETTFRLAEIVRQANPRWENRIDPATRSFQAIRIQVNHELEDLERCLAQVLEVLAVGGRLAVISFHSLEDRIVKHFIRAHGRADVFPRGLPVTEAQLPRARLRAVGKAVQSSEQEIALNARARSAVLRVAEKLA